MKAATAAVALGFVGRYLLHRRRAIAQVAPELRSPGMWLPLDVDSRLALAVARRFFVTPTDVVAGVDVREGWVTAADGVPVRVYVYEPRDRAPGGPAMLWIHGGGTIIGTAAADHGWVSAVARDLGILVVSVDYRLAPEHPFPTPPEDCHAALRWLRDGAERLGVDPSRIAVGGASAGGLLAATVCQMAHDRGEGEVAFQLLVYPMLDDRTVIRDDHDGRGRLGWTPKSNRWAWSAYLGHSPQPEEPRPYAVPARREDLGGLPPAWIGVGDLDLFHDEDVRYAERLRAAGVPVDLHVEPRMPHGVDMPLWESVPSMGAWRARMVDALRNGLDHPAPSQ